MNMIGAGDTGYNPDNPGRPIVDRRKNSTDRRQGIDRRRVPPNGSGFANLTQGDPTPHVHYLRHSSSPLIGVLSLLVAFLIMVIGILQIRESSANAPAILAVDVSSGETMPGVPVLTVLAEDWQINGQGLDQGDLLFRLSAQAARSPAVVIEHAPGLSANRLTQAIDLANQAGFTQIGLRSVAPAGN